jgi:hypothetical protein
MEAFGKMFSGEGMPDDAEMGAAFDFGKELGALYTWGDDRLLQTITRGLLDNSKDKWVLLNRDLVQTSSIPKPRQVQGDMSMLVVDQFTPRLLVFSVDKKGQWLIEVEADGKVGQREWWSNDLLYPIPIPGRKLLARLLPGMWDREGEVPNAFDTRERWEYVVLKENLDRKYPLLTAPDLADRKHLTFKVRTVSEKGIIYFDEEKISEKKTRNVAMLADFKLRPKVRFTLPDEVSDYDMRNVSLSGDWLLAEMVYDGEWIGEFPDSHPPEGKSLQRVCLFKVRW